MSSKSSTVSHGPMLAGQSVEQLVALMKERFGLERDATDIAATASAKQCERHGHLGFRFFCAIGVQR